ncbi:hypothetical protein THIOM_005635 [Candidatus Thiomargarita nelsonii]|uniref:Uncharacterized protein n=1 Tax=Candidatus Thiomargarita nelsonii TaxID=1003181 RepID=A0A176RSL8_9GAMM|nr:hypothetical protein THIOM_005635 [Candidatus Thiomargarita nelsonii]
MPKTPKYLKTYRSVLKPIDKFLSQLACFYAMRKEKHLSFLGPLRVCRDSLIDEKFLV